MLWNFTPISRACRSMGRKAPGNHIPWSINAVSQNPIRQMNCSCALRPCVWRRCSAVPFLRAPYFTESLAAARWYPLPRNCGRTSAGALTRCISCAAAVTRRRPSPPGSCKPFPQGFLCLPQLVRRDSVRHICAAPWKRTATRYLLNTLFVNSEDIYLSFTMEKM